MITKDDLVDMLGKSLANEDQFILDYGKDFVSKIAEVDFLSPEQKLEINDILGVLLEDTQRHKQTISDSIERIKAGEKNEY
jgi:hypothetical protein